MSTDQSTGGATDETSGQSQDQVADESKASGNKDSVAYETYRKTLSEAKKLKEQLAAQSQALQRAQEEKLSAEGKKDELIAQLQKKASELEKKNKDQLAQFVQSQLSVQIRDEARSLGAIDPDDVVGAVDLSGVDVDDTFSANKDQLKDAINGLKKSKPHWFSKAGPKINTELPGGVVPQASKKELKDMSKQELWAELNKLKGSR